MRRTLRWNHLAAAAVALTIALTLYRYVDTLHSGAVAAYLLYPASIAALALLIDTRHFLRFAEVRLMGVFFVWVLVVVALNRSRANNALSSEWFYSLCATSFLCFSLPYAFEKADLKRLFAALALFTVILSAVFCAFGVYYALSGHALVLPAGTEGPLGIAKDGRLWMFGYPNAAAPICGIGVVLSVYLFFTSSRTRLRWLLVAPFLVCLAALALTDGRTGILSTAVAVGMETFLFLGIKMVKNAKRSRRVLLALALGAAASVLLYLCTVGVIETYNAIQSGRAVAAATDPSATKKEKKRKWRLVSSRDISDLESVASRIDIWKGTLQGLKENPSILLTGTTPLIAGKLMDPYFPANAPRENFHNSFLAVLVSFGLPGLLLVIAILTLLIVRSVRFVCRTFFDDGSLHARLLSAIVLFALGESMMEQFLFVDGMPNIVWVWFLLAAGFLFVYAGSRMQAADTAPHTET